MRPSKPQNCEYAWFSASMPSTVPRAAGEMKKNTVATLRAVALKPSIEASLYTSTVLPRWAAYTNTWLRAGKSL